MANILIVDDEVHIRILLEQTLENLEDEGVELNFAANGEEAMTQIKEQAPDLIFLDVMMPKLNGFEVCQHIRANPAWNSIYIILLTAKGQEYDKHHGVSLGANTYMTKPFHPDEIEKVAREILKLD